MRTSWVSSMVRRAAPGLEALCVVLVGAAVLYPLLATESDVLTAPGDRTTLWRLTWSDEFSGAVGAPDPAKWTLVTGHLGYNSELEYYTPKNATLDGRGHLVITARDDDASQYDCSPRKCAATSARLFTEGKFAQTYGRLEARIKLPRGQGMWPAFWALRSSQGSGRGEIDVMENIGKEPKKIHSSLHGEKDYNSTKSHELTGDRALADDFHVFAADWFPDHISFSMDGHVYTTRRKADAPRGNWTFDQPFYLLLNLAVGGDWPGAPDSTTHFPQQMTVDYVRVYSAVPP